MAEIQAENPLEGIDMNDMNAGDTVFWRAVAQGKVFLRREIIKCLGDRAGGFSVRTGGGGVTMEKL